MIKIKTKSISNAIQNSFEIFILTIPIKHDIVKVADNSTNSYRSQNDQESWTRIKSTQKLSNFGKNKIQLS